MIRNAIIIMLKKIIKKILFALNSFGRACRYKTAKIIYRVTARSVSPSFSHPREIGLIIIDPYNNDTCIKLPPDYLQLIDIINEGIHRKMNIAKNCVYFLRDKNIKRRLDIGDGLPESTWDVQEYRHGLISKIQSKGAHDIAGVETLCQAIMPEVEKNIYGSYVEVASSFAEMKFLTEDTKDKDGFFHSDRHYEDTIRMIIYMSDVGVDDAPFEYLRHQETRKTIRIRTADHPTFTMKGRIPKEALSNYMNNRYERFKITGKKGTIILFDSKIIHKANSPKNNSRTVLVLPIRPATVKRERFVDPKCIEAVYV